MFLEKTLNTPYTYISILIVTYFLIQKNNIKYKI